MRTLLIALAASTAIAYPAVAAGQQSHAQANAPAAQHQQIARDLTSDQIRMLQQALEQKGFKAGVPDGIWHQQTTDAIRNFQISKAMPHDGLDLQTIAALGLNPAQFAARQTGSTVGLGSGRFKRSEQADLNAFHNATMGLLDATAAVTMDGSQVVDVRFGMHDGKPVYFVHTYNGGKKTFWDGMVDANSGKVMGSGQTTPESELAPRDRTQLQAALNAKWSLEDAVNAVEQRAKGDAIDAWLIEGKGKTAYEVRIDQNGKTKIWHVDPMTGALNAA
jgi:peptidoglycan hydrolase-like protein with peptidoglycan-binding domain